MAPAIFSLNAAAPWTRTNVGVVAAGRKIPRPQAWPR
jgi:hypothetical protein